MDRATFIGLLLGGCALIGGHFLEGGSVGMILQLTALIIVFGGTAGAVCLSFSWAQLKQSLKTLPRIFREPVDDGPEHLSRVIELAYRARREGLLALEREIKDLPDPFWQRGLRLVIDGFPPAEVREIMEVELVHQEETDSVPAQVFEAAGGYAPTIGILGAVLGLIQVMQHLTEPAKLGTGVAVAFVATIYGVASANLIFLPIAHKLRVRQQKSLRAKEMILEGTLALGQGDHPRLIAERLQGFFSDEHDRQISQMTSPKVRVLNPHRKPRTSSYAPPSLSS